MSIIVIIYVQFSMHSKNKRLYFSSGQCVSQTLTLCLGEDICISLSIFISLRPNIYIISLYTENTQCVIHIVVYRKGYAGLYCPENNKLGY